MIAFRDGVVGVIIERGGHEAGALMVRLHKRGYQKACSVLSVPCEEDRQQQPSRSQRPLIKSALCWHTEFGLPDTRSVRK